MAAPVTIYGSNSEAITTTGKIPDNNQGPGAPFRQASRGELFVENIWNGMQSLATEGSYWLGSTLTPGTALTLSVATGVTFSDTQALLVVNNTDTVLNPQGKTIYLDFIKIIITTAPTGQTIWHIAHRIDSIIRGIVGTQLGATGVLPRPSNMVFGGSAIGQVFALGATAVSVAASANVRNVGRNVIRGVLPNIGDDLTIKFGSAEMAAGGVGISAATPSAITLFAPPIAIGPQQSYVMNEWGIGRSAAGTGEIIVGWSER